MSSLSTRGTLAASVLAVSLSLAGGCDGDDDCANCCECGVDTTGPELVYTLRSGDCSSCEEQCADFAKREFNAEPNYFDRADPVPCED